jgi:hypothetical protein
MDGENIYENPPVYFGKDLDGENEYLRRQREKTRKLLEATDSKNATEMIVKLIYGDDFELPVRMLDTKVEAYGERVLELADGIEDVESYNDFMGKYVAEALRYLHKKGYVMGARFGREGSPVLYVNPPYWENQASNYVQKQGYAPRKYTDSERESMYTAIKRKLKSLEPDELDRTEYYGVRAWWD